MESVVLSSSELELLPLIMMFSAESYSAVMIGLKFFFLFFSFSPPLPPVSFVVGGNICIMPLIKRSAVLILMNLINSSNCTIYSLMSGFFA